MKIKIMSKHIAQIVRASYWLHKGQRFNIDKGDGVGKNDLQCINEWKEACGCEEKIKCL